MEKRKGAFEVNELDWVELLDPQFDYAFYWQNLMQIIKLLGFVLSTITVLFSKYYPVQINEIWITLSIFILSILVIIFIFLIDQKYKNEHSKAEKIRKIAMLQSIYKTTPNKSEQVKIINSLNREVVVKAKNKTLDNIKNKSKKVNSTLDFHTDKIKFLSIFAEKIQENCFSTSEYQKKNLERLNQRVIPFWSFSLLLIFMYCVYLFKISNNNLEITQYVSLIFSTVFSLNIIPYYLNISDAQRRLSTIETALNYYKNDPNIKEDEILYYFTEYNEAVNGMYMWPKQIREKNKKQVGQDWESIIAKT